MDGGGGVVQIWTDQKSVSAATSTNEQTYAPGPAHLRISPAITERAHMSKMIGRRPCAPPPGSQEST